MGIFHFPIYLALQWGYYVIIPLLMLFVVSGFGFGGEGGKVVGGCVGWGVQGAFGDVVAP